MRSDGEGASPVVLRGMLTPTGAASYQTTCPKLHGDSVVVSEYGVSDGYCPPPEECGSTVIRAKAKVRAGLHLVPDPEGTFPPP